MIIETACSHFQFTLSSFCLLWLFLQELVNFFGKESGAVVDLLSEDSSNIVQLIRDAYEVSAVLSSRLVHCTLENKLL